MDVVHRGQHVSAARGQDANALLHLSGDVLGRAEGQRVLAVAGGAPEDEPVAELAFQLPRVHALGRRLHRVEDVDAHLDQRGDQIEDRPVVVHEDLPAGVLVDPVQPSLVVGHDQLAEHLDREERALLRAQVVVELDDIDPVAQGVLEPAEVLEPHLGELLVQGVDVIGLGGQGDHPRLEVAAPEPEEKLVRRAHFDDHRVVGVLSVGLGLGPVVVALLVGDRRQIERLGIGVGRAGKFVEPIQIEPARRHLGDRRAVRAREHERAVGLDDGVKPGGHLDHRAAGKLPRLPAVVADAEGHLRRRQAHAIGPEPLHHGPLDLGDHLVDVEDARRRIEAQLLLDLVVGRGRDARLPRAAQVHRHAVRLLVVDRAKDPFA